MTDLLFNELLDSEVMAIASFYQDQEHFEPVDYIRIVGDGPTGTAISYVENINPGDNNLVRVLSKYGAHYAIKRPVLDPLCIFVAQTAIGTRIDDPSSTPLKVITVYGITNDGRYNMGVLPLQWDEDGRLYAVPSEVYHFGQPDGTLEMDVLPYLEFFRINDELRLEVPA